MCNNKNKNKRWTTSKRTRRRSILMSFSLTSKRKLGKRHCSIRRPCYMLHQNDPQPFIEPSQMRTPLSRQQRETSLRNEQGQLWTGASADGSGMYRIGTSLECGQQSLSCGRTTSGTTTTTSQAFPWLHEATMMTSMMTTTAALPQDNSSRTLKTQRQSLNHPNHNNWQPATSTPPL